MPFWLFYLLLVAGICGLAGLWLFASRRRAERAAIKFFPGEGLESVRQGYVRQRLREGGFGSLPVLSRPYVAKLRRQQQQLAERDEDQP